MLLPSTRRALVLVHRVRLLKRVCHFTHQTLHSWRVTRQCVLGIPLRAKAKSERRPESLVKVVRKYKYGNYNNTTRDCLRNTEKWVRLQKCNAGPKIRKGSGFSWYWTRSR